MATRNKELKKDDTKIELIAGNIPLVTVQLLHTINQNIVKLTTYLKNQDMEKKRG